MTWRLRGWPGVSRGTWHPPLVGATRASPALPARAPPAPHHRCEGCPCGGPSDGKKTREPDMAVRAELERAGTVSSADVWLLDLTLCTAPRSRRGPRRKGIGHHLDLIEAGLRVEDVLCGAPGAG